MSRPLDDMTCPDCDGAGTGYRWGQDVDCSTCSGTGVVTPEPWEDAAQEEQDRVAMTEAWDNWNYDRACDYWELRKELGEHEEQFWGEERADAA